MLVFFSFILILQYFALIFSVELLYNCSGASSFSFFILFTFIKFFEVSLIARVTCENISGECSRIGGSERARSAQLGIADRTDKIEFEVS